MHVGGSIAHGDPIAPVILGTTSILAFAIIGRVAARKLGQPTVVGELLMGILLGNLAWYFGIDLIVVLREGPRVFDVVSQTLSGVPLDVAAVAVFGEQKGAEIVEILSGPAGGRIFQVVHTVDVFSRYGVIFLLFMVGLDIDLDDMKKVGRESLQVALIGIAVPVLLGFGVATMLRPEMTIHSNFFLAATLAATSIGVSARVLKGLGRAASSEGRIILGAAVYDDVLALVLLAVISGVVVNGSLDIVDVGLVIITATAFLGAAIWFGSRVVRLAAHVMRRLDIVEAKMFISYLFVMLLAWMSNLVGLATIIGAFAAGMILRDSDFPDHFSTRTGRNVSVRELIMPLEVILVPIFFILMGIQVKLESFASWPVVLLAGALIVVAVVGKVLSGLGAKRKRPRLAIGIGMLPRGEVGLVFAAIGVALGVIDDSVFSAIALMVIVTTLVAPPWLKWALSRRSEPG